MGRAAPAWKTVVEEWKALLAIERAFRKACRVGGDLIACKPGCDGCCQRPFAITQADAARLRRGLAEAPKEVAEGILERARANREAAEMRFPGDLGKGELTADIGLRLWFFARWKGPACPVLDPERGVCLLRKHRPAACRLYGPLIRIGATTSGPCDLCYEGVPMEEMSRYEVEVKGDWGDEEARPETIVPLALLAGDADED